MNRIGMVFRGESGDSIMIAIEEGEGRRPVLALWVDGESAHEGVQLDENHATALALALQAAVAEIQARAVGR